LACGNTLRGVSDAHPLVSRIVEPIKPARSARRTPSLMIRRTRPVPPGYRGWQLNAAAAETF
jgi:hypothetical protein